MKMFISFVVCMIVAPGLFMVHVAGALMIRDGDVNLISLTAMIAPVFVGALLHIFYPLSKIDEAFASRA